MTTNPFDTQSASDPAVISSLLHQRSTLQEWLARLDAEGGAANPRVVERVRADYQQRLRLVLDELGQHLGGLRQQRSTLAEALAEADFRADQAQEELEEARLRHRIGELADVDWSERQPALEDAVAAMAERREQVQGELSRLDDILQQVESGMDAAEARPTAREEARLEEPPVASRTTFAAGAVAPEPIPAPSAPPSLDPDRDFLEELDRAMADSHEPGGRAKTGVRCKECGYTNDAGAAYCGVCGVDLK